MILVNLLFTVGLALFLTGVALVDYRAAMVLAGALAMAFSYQLGSSLVARRNADRSDAP